MASTDAVLAVAIICLVLLIVLTVRVFTNRANSTAAASVQESEKAQSRLIEDVVRRTIEAIQAANPSVQLQTPQQVLIDTNVHHPSGISAPTPVKPLPNVYTPQMSPSVAYTRLATSISTLPSTPERRSSPSLASTPEADVPVALDTIVVVEESKK